MKSHRLAKTLSEKGIQIGGHGQCVHLCSFYKAGSSLRAETLTFVQDAGHRMGSANV